MKTKEELNALKEEVETVSRKLVELTDEEMARVVGGCGAELDNSDHGVSRIVELLLDTIKELKEKIK